MQPSGLFQITTCMFSPKTLNVYDWLFCFVFFLLGLCLWNQQEDGRENHSSTSHSDSQILDTRSPAPSHPITLEEMEEEERKRSLIHCFQCSQDQGLAFVLLVVNTVTHLGLIAVYLKSCDLLRNWGPILTLLVAAAVSVLGLWLQWHAFGYADNLSSSFFPLHPPPFCLHISSAGGQHKEAPLRIRLCKK